MLDQNLGTIQNISQKGILLKVTHPVKYNYVEMNFNSKRGMRHNMDGKVIYCKETPSGQYEIGIRLLGSEDQIKVFVKALVHYHLQQQKMPNIKILGFLTQ